MKKAYIKITCGLYDELDLIYQLDPIPISVDWFVELQINNKQVIVLKVEKKLLVSHIAAKIRSKFQYDMIVWF